MAPNIKQASVALFLCLVEGEKEKSESARNGRKGDNGRKESVLRESAKGKNKREDVRKKRTEGEIHSRILHPIHSHPLSDLSLILNLFLPLLSRIPIRKPYPTQYLLVKIRFHDLLLIWKLCRYPFRQAQGSLKLPQCLW
jgi:hypothetical protein